MRASFLLVLFSGLVAGLAIGLMLSAVRTPADHAGPVLWLEVVHRVCTSIGGLGTFVALIFVVGQFNLLRSQSELVQRNILASMDSELYSRLDSFNKFIVEHHREYELLDDPFEAQELPDHKSTLHHLCDLGITFYEEGYKHHVRYRLLNTEDLEEWKQNMAHFFSKPYVRGYWKTVARRYPKGYRAFADALVEKLEAS